MVKIIYPFLLVPLKSLIQVMACCQLDDKPFPELILKSMTPYHVSWAQKVEVCYWHVILDGNKIMWFGDWSDIDPTSCGNSYQTDVVITLAHGLLLCGIMQYNTIYESYMQWLIIKMVLSSYSKLLCLQD